MNNISLGFTPDLFPQGTHICYIYKDEEERRALEVLPNETSIASFLCRSLSTIPGVKDVHVCIRGVVTPDDAMYRELCRAYGENGSTLATPPLVQLFPLRTSHQVYGVLFLSIDNEDQFSPYQPYLANMANTVATLLESRDHVHQLHVANERIQRGRDELEIRVGERTAELTIKNAELEQEVRERKQTEIALQRSETNLNRAQAVAQLGSWYLDVANNRLEWSAESHRIFGIPVRFRASAPLSSYPNPLIYNESGGFSLVNAVNAVKASGFICHRSFRLTLNCRQRNRRLWIVFTL